MLLVGLFGQKGNGSAETAVPTASESEASREILSATTALRMTD